MKKLNNKLRLLSSIALLGMVVLSSCNKDLEGFAPIATPTYPSGPGVAATLAANPNYTFYAALIARAGMTATLNDSTKTYTIFATDNAGMKLFVNNASGGAVPLGAPDANFLAFINSSLPVTSAAGIVQYNTVGGKFLAANIPATSPNYPLPSQIILDATQPFLRLTLFPSRATGNASLNSLPLTGVDLAATNGVIHTVYSIVAPTTSLLKGALATESTLSYFRAAIARADSGSTGLAKFDSLLNYGVTNMTVLAPNDAAFQTLVYGLVYAKVFAATGNAAVANANANGAVAAGPAFLGTNNISTAEVKGIIAYHLLASLTPSTTTPYQPNIRVFGINVPATPVFFKTLVNGAIAIHPGVMAKATYTGPFATGLQFTGYGTFPPGGAPFSGPAANVLTQDKFAVNGVYHIIDRVLLPQ